MSCQCIEPYVHHSFVHPDREKAAFVPNNLSECDLRGDYLDLDLDCDCDCNCNCNCNCDCDCDCDDLLLKAKRMMMMMMMNGFEREVVDTVHWHEY